MEVLIFDPTVVGSCTQFGPRLLSRRLSPVSTTGRPSQCVPGTRLLLRTSHYSRLKE